MIYKTVKMGDGNLTLFIHENYEEMNPNRKRPMVLICPGGGYGFCCDREADPVAIRFLSYDFNVAVLRYTVNSENDADNPIYPKPQVELADSIAYIREHSDVLNTNSDMIAVLGFSAGGHLAASVGCLWNRFNKKARPDALILCYALTTQDDWVTKQLFGNKEVLPEVFNLDKQVSKYTPPTFLWCTKTDSLVPYTNSTRFKEALDANNVPNELHIFENGHHGLSLSNKEVRGHGEWSEVNDEVAKWPEMARNWLIKTFGDNWY